MLATKFATITGDSKGGSTGAGSCRSTAHVTLPALAQPGVQVRYERSVNRDLAFAPDRLQRREP
jgi:hypothetical protein